MVHDNYFSIEADDEREAGRILGHLFSNTINSDLEYYKQSNNWKKRIQLSQPFLNATKASFPLVYDELKGHSEGAGISIQDLWTLMIEEEINATFHEKCTSVMTNEGLLIGHNEDWNIEAKNYLTVLKSKINGVTTLELYYIGTLGGASISINSHGVIQAINSVDHVDHQIGIPKSVISKVLSRCANPLNELKAITKLVRSSGYHHLIQSPKLDCLSIESSATKIVSDNAQIPFVHTNHYLSEVLDHEKLNESCGTLSRYERARKLLENTMSVLEMKKLLSDTTDGPEKSIMNERTIGKMVIDNASLEVHIWLLREKSKDWVVYPIDFFS